MQTGGYVECIPDDGRHFLLSRRLGKAFCFMEGAVVLKYFPQTVIFNCADWEKWGAKGSSWWQIKWMKALSKLHVQIKATFCSYNAHSYTAPPPPYTHKHTADVRPVIYVSSDPFSFSHRPEHLFRTAASLFHPISNSSDPSQFFVAPTTLYSCLESPVDRGVSPRGHRGQRDWSDLVRMHHLITKVIYYVSCLCLLLDSKFHEGGGFCLFSSWMYPKSHAWHMVGAR